MNLMHFAAAGQPRFSRIEKPCFCKFLSPFSKLLSQRPRKFQKTSPQIRPGGFVKLQNLRISESQNLRVSESQSLSLIKACFFHRLHLRFSDVKWEIYRRFFNSCFYSQNGPLMYLVRNGRMSNKKTFSFALLFLREIRVMTNGNPRMCPSVYFAQRKPPTRNAQRALYRKEHCIA